MIIPKGNRRLAYWLVYVDESSKGTITYGSVQTLPGADLYTQQYRAGCDQADELAALYDDACRDIHMCENLFALVLEDVTAVQLKMR